MTKNQTAVVLIACAALLMGCKEKKQSQDIIAAKVEAPKPSAPIRMQPYSDQRDVQWLGKTYKIEIQRVPDDSLRMVSDEVGQKYVDNRISLVVRRTDGSVAISKKFLKSSFDAYLDKNYRNSGILEGFVFDEVDGACLKFAASVSMPQSDDEYIPLEVKVDNFGNLTIARDSDMDTSGADAGDDGDDDGV